MKRIFFLLTIVVLYIAVCGGSASSQDTDGAATLPEIREASVLSVLRLRDIFPDFDTRTALISPDGSMIAVSNSDELCLLYLADNSATCYERPEDFRWSPESPEWSPDSAHIVLTEDATQRMYESDIWLFDVENGVFTNRTDDGVFGQWLRMGGGEYALDYTPRWNPVTGDLYFFRSERSSNENIPFTLELYRLSPEGGEAELMHDLTGQMYLEGSITIHDPRYSVYLDGAAAFSSDGTRLAVRVIPALLDDPAAGIWVLDVEGDQPPQHVAPLFIEDGLPEYQIEAGELLAVDGLAWTRNGQGLVFVAKNHFQRVGILSNTYYVDVATGDVTPLVDFGVYVEQSELEQAEAGSSGYALNFFQPDAAALLPDGATLLIYSYDHYQQSGCGISAFVIPPDVDTLPVEDGFEVLYFSEELELLQPMYNTSISADGKLLMGGYLITLGQ